MITITTNIANAMMVTGSLRSLVNGGFLYLYTGPVPLTADEAKDGSSAFVMKLSVNDDVVTGLTFQSSATNGVLRATAGQLWKGTNGEGSTLTPTFFRFCVGSDDGTGVAGVSDYRIQGTIGEDMTYDMWLTNATFADTETLELDDAQFDMPIA